MFPPPPPKKNVKLNGKYFELFYVCVCAGGDCAIESSGRCATTETTRKNERRERGNRRVQFRKGAKEFISRRALISRDKRPDMAVGGTTASSSLL